MPDSPWLYPELANPLVVAHDRYFKSILPPGQLLPPGELDRFGKELFSAGWCFELKMPGKVIPAVLLLKRNAPFAEPRIALFDDRYYLKWPHVEENGLLCLQDGEAINHLSGVKLTRHYIERAEKLVDNSFNERNTEDFITEFHSYWRLWCDRKPGSYKEALLLSKSGPPTRDIHLLSLGGYILASDKIEKGMKWVQERFPEKKFPKMIFLKEYSSG